MNTHTADDSVVSDFVAAITAGPAADHVADEWVELLRELTHVRDVEPDEVLVRHHAVAEHLAFLVEGEVRYEHLVSGRPRERVSHDAHRWVPIGWSSVHLGRHRVTAVAATHGRVLCLPLTAWDELTAKAPRLWALLAEFTFRAAARMLWEARGTEPVTPAPGASPASRLPLVESPEHAVVQDMYQRSACFSALPTACREWLSDHSTLHRAGEGVQILAEGAASEGLWLLQSGRTAMRFRVAARDEGDGEQLAVRHAVRSGTLLCWSAATDTLPAPYEVEASRDTTLAFVPREELAGLLEQHPAWLGAIFEQQLWQLRGYLLSTRTHYGHGSDDGGISALRDVIEDSKPVLPVNSRLYGIPYLLENKLTRGDGFRRLYTTHFEGSAAERSLASLALDLLRDLERGHRFFTGMQATYDAVVRDEQRDAHDVRRVASRYFRDALTHVPYVIKGLEHLPDDGNCILIYNHMAYADDSVLPNGFLFNPDSHFVSSVVMEPKYGDGLRVARTNADTEFWRADYYDRLGHIGVVTPESGWRDETREEKARRKQRFLAGCEDALAKGRPLAIAPEGTITEEESTTEQTPAPMKAGAFVMSARFASRPSIVPVALANFDRPAHRAVFSCVIKPPFTMEERHVDVDDRDSMQAFLAAYRGEFRNHVEEAIELARHIQTPEAELDGIVTNLGRVDTVNEEFEHDVRALEHRAITPTEGVQRTVFYGSSTFRMWDDLAEQVGVTDVVNLGFGGSTFEACRHYFERLVVPYAPTRLVIYCGDNDLARGATAADVTDEFTAFDEMVSAHLPRTTCWFVSVKPSPGRRQAMDRVRRANAQIADRIEQLAHWEYVDWYRYMVDERGMPNPQLFTDDAVHLNEAGYGVLAAVLRRALATTRAG